MSNLVFKILPASQTFHAVNYNTKKEKSGSAQMVYFKNFGLLHFGNRLPEKKEIVSYFEKYSEANSRTKHKQFHAMLSCKGRELTHEELKDKALMIMEKLGHEAQPILIYAHKDTANNHVHIVTTRIDKNGNKINDSFERKRTAEILLQLQSRDVKSEFAGDLKKCFTYQFSTEAQFRLLMEKQGYKIFIENNVLKFFKYGKHQGDLTQNEITSRFQKQDNKNRIRQIKAIIEKYQRQYDTQLKMPQTYTDNPKPETELSKFLRNTLGMECVFFTNKAGNVHGYTIIDHAHKIVFKGSDIMPLAQFIQPAGTQISDTIQPNHKPVADEPPVNHSSNEPEKPSLESTKDNINDVDIIPEAIITILKEAEKSNQHQAGMDKKLRRRRRNFF